MITVALNTKTDLKAKENGIVAMNVMTNNQNYLKLYNIFREKYIISFHSNFRPYEIDKSKDLETQWHLYLVSIGCERSTTHTENSIQCPDSYHRAYNNHYIKIPEELAIKALTLGYLP